MTNIDKFRAAKAERELVKAARDALVGGTATAQIVSGGSNSPDGMFVRVHIARSAGELLASPVFAECLAVAVAGSFGPLMTQALAEANARLLVAKAAAIAEANDVINETGA